MVEITRIFLKIVQVIINHEEHEGREGKTNKYGYGCFVTFCLQLL